VSLESSEREEVQHHVTALVAPKQTDKAQAPTDRHGGSARLAVRLLAAWIT
jgi:hypothetical protein